MNIPKKTLAALLVIAFATSATIPISNAADASFPNNFKINLKWKSTTFTVYVEPGKNFVVGKSPANKYVEKYAQTACGSWYQFWQLGVVGASGKGMSTWASKNAKTYYKVTKRGWGLDENGEDQYTFDTYCYGALGTTLTGRSNYYRLLVYAPDYYRFYNPKPNQITYVLESPYYTYQDLLSVNGNIQMEVEMSDNPQQAYDWYFYKGGCINMDCQPTKWIPESTYVSTDG
jgi:hypothetical protein